MLDLLIPKLIEAISGKSIASFLEDTTGISARTWRDGGPKRASTMDKGMARMEEQIREEMRDRGWPEEEIEAARSYVNADGRDRALPFSRLVRGCGTPGRFEFQHTLAIAKSLDRLNAILWEFHKADDVQGFRGAFADEGILGTLDEWLSFAGEEKDLVLVRKALEDAKTWEDCWLLVKAASAMAFYQLLACWDVEFLSVYLTNRDGGRGMAPQPIVELFMPKLKPDAKPLPNGSYPSHGLFHLPLRRLLDFCYCLSVLHREGKWPSKTRVTRTQVAGAGGVVLQGDASDQPLAKIRKGLRGLSSGEFYDVWISMVGRDRDGEAVMPPWPWYMASQILTLLFIEK